MSEHWIDGIRIPDPDPKYVLSASIGLTTLRLRFDADDDTHAALIAMTEVMDRSAMERDFTFGDKFWTEGVITLTSPSGALLRTMISERGESDD